MESQGGERGSEAVVAVTGSLTLQTLSVKVKGEESEVFCSFHPGQ